jgi:hypothetical protein
MQSEGWRKSPNTRNNYIARKSADINTNMISHGFNIESVVQSHAMLAKNHLTGPD